MLLPKKFPKDADGRVLKMLYKEGLDFNKPQQVEFLDLLSGKIGVTRSQILRDLAEAVAVQYYNVAEFVSAKPAKASKNPLYDLIGAEKSKTGTIGLNVDEIYLED